MSGLALDYLLGFCITDKMVASYPTASLEKIKPVQSGYNSLESHKRSNEHFSCTSVVPHLPWASYEFDTASSQFDPSLEN